jgi:hypothetical protein
MKLVQEVGSMLTLSQALSELAHLVEFGIDLQIHCTIGLNL